MSIMDQRKSYILTNTQKKQIKTFYVHDGSTEIVYVGKYEAKYFMSMMDHWKSYIWDKRITKYFMSMMDQR